MKLIEQIHYGALGLMEAAEQRLHDARMRRAIRFSIWRNAQSRGLSVREARRIGAQYDRDHRRERSAEDQSLKG